MMDMLDKSYGEKKSRNALQISLLVHLYLLWGHPSNVYRNIWAPNWEIGFCRHRYLDHQGISCWRPMWYPPAVYIIPWILLRLLLIFLRSRHKPAVSTAMLIKGLPWRVLTVCTINFIFSIAFFPLHPHVHMTHLRSLQNDFFQFIQDLRCPDMNVAEATGERRTTTTAGIRKFGWISEQRLFVHVASDLTNYIIPCLFGNGMCKASVITWILLPVLFKAADKHPKLCFLTASLHKRLLVLPKRLQVDLAFWNNSAHGNFSPPLCWIFLPLPYYPLCHSYNGEEVCDVKMDESEKLSWDRIPSRRTPVFWMSSVLKLQSIENLPDFAQLSQCSRHQGGFFFSNWTKFASTHPNTNIAPQKWWLKVERLLIKWSLFWRTSEFSGDYIYKSSDPLLLVGVNSE